MTRFDHYNRWYLSEDDLKDLDAVKARDIIITCFFEAQKEMFRRIKQKLGSGADDQDVRRRIEAVVRVAFEDIGGNFDQPTKQMLENVVGRLASLAQAWGTPEDIIAHHRQQIMRVLEALA